MASRIKVIDQFNCMHCGATSGPELFLEDCLDCYLGKASRVDYFKCSECGLVQMYPLPTDLSLFYEEYPIHKKKSFVHRCIRRFVMAPAYFDVQSARCGSVLLDYGCGDGWFLESCKGMGLAPVGYEPAPHLASDLSARLKLPVYSSMERLLGDFRSKVDIVTMHFVLEHLTDLGLAFRTVKQLLAPQGIFFFTVPNLESWEAKLFGRRWHCLDPPRHISFPHFKVIQELAGRHSFKVVTAQSVPFPNGFAASVPAAILGRFNFALYALSMPLGILLSRIAPSGITSFKLASTTALVRET